MPLALISFGLMDGRESPTHVSKSMLHLGRLGKVALIAVYFQASSSLKNVIFKGSVFHGQQAGHSRGYYCNSASRSSGVRSGTSQSSGTSAR